MTSTASWTAVGRDRRRLEPDAGVDDLEAGVARRDRDHLGAVRVAVEAGLADEQARPAAGRGDVRLDAARAARPSSRRRRADAARRRRRSAARYSPHTPRSVPAHSPVVTRASAHAIEASMIGSPARAAASSAASAAFACAGIALRAGRRERRERLLGRRRIGLEHAAVVAADERRRQRRRSTC